MTPNPKRRMGQAVTAGIAHLTTVNPYVAGTLRSKAPGAAHAVHMPRQLSGAALAGGNAVTGVSGFAFQGTNAHVVLGRSVRSPVPPAAGVNAAAFACGVVDSDFLLGEPPKCCIPNSPPLLEAPLWTHATLGPCESALETNPVFSGRPTPWLLDSHALTSAATLQVK